MKTLKEKIEVMQALEGGWQIQARPRKADVWTNCNLEPLLVFFPRGD